MLRPASSCSDYRRHAHGMTVTVKQDDAWRNTAIQFIGRGGRVLHEALDSPADYTSSGDEGYVRAKVIESNGRMAWCQPVWVQGSERSRFRVQQVRPSSPR